MSMNEKPLRPTDLIFPAFAYSNPRSRAKPRQGAHIDWRKRLRRAFFPALQIYMATLVIVGFTPSFYSKPAHAAGMKPVILVHAAIMTIWILYIAVQGMLPFAGKVRLHRMLGWFGVALSVLVLVSGVQIMIQGIHDGWDPFRLGSGEAFAVIPVRDLSTFAVFVAGGVLARRGAPDAHKRLMTLATLSVIPAGLARLGAFVPEVAITVLNFAPIGAMVAFDLATRRRPLASTVVGGTFLVLATPAALAIANQPWWLDAMRAIS